MLRRRVSVALPVAGVVGLCGVSAVCVCLGA